MVEPFRPESCGAVLKGCPFAPTQTQHSYLILHMTVPVLALVHRSHAAPPVRPPYRFLTPMNSTDFVPRLMMLHPPIILSLVKINLSGRSCQCSFFKASSICSLLYLLTHSVWEREENNQWFQNVSNEQGFKLVAVAVAVAWPKWHSTTGFAMLQLVIQRQPRDSGSLIQGIPTL